MHDSDSILKTILEHSPNAIVILNELGAVHVWSSASAELFGFAESDALGLNFSELVGADACAKWLQKPSQCASTETLIRCNDGRQIWVDQTSHQFDLDGKKWTYIELRDATARKRRELELEKAATTDELSQLTNRRGFQAALESNLGDGLALAIIDIDYLKSINDRFHHETGDEAIMFLASAMKNHFSDAICLARLGGDEFGLLIRIDIERELGSKILRDRLNSFRKTISSETFSRHKINLTISIGAAIAHSDQTSSRELLTRADRMLYQAKDAGRNSVAVVFTD